MKPDEIKRCLESCAGGDCEDCIYKGETACTEYLKSDVIAYINELEAEVEKVTTAYPKTFESIRKIYTTAKSEAIKEFAERLNDQFGKCTLIRDCFYVGYDINDVSKAIDNLVKEMVGD